MNFDVVGTTVGISTMLPMIGLFFVAARMTPQGAVSLPCVMALTSIVYFYVLPFLVLSNRDDGFFGMYLTDLQWAHYAALLYAAGAAVAFVVNVNAIAIDPAAPVETEREFDPLAYRGLWMVAVVGVIGLVVTDQLSFYNDVNASAPASDLLFLNQSLNLLVGLTVLLTVRNNFNLPSLAVVATVLIIFLQVGFRFRIMILLAGLMTSFASVRGFRFRTAYVIVGAALAIALGTLVGAARNYGRGLDFHHLEGSIEEALIVQLAGECGTVYVLTAIAGRPLPDLITFEPWLVALGRLVPTFLWPDKPSPDYLLQFTAGMAVAGGAQAGVAAPQHAEMLLQFGWIGLPFLSFFYFSLVAALLRGLSVAGRDARIVGYSLAPAFFGFYMQTRGYFFQMLTDGLFMFAPLFLVSHARRRSENGRAPR